MTADTCLVQYVAAKGFPLEVLGDGYRVSRNVGGPPGAVDVTRDQARPGHVTTRVVFDGEWLLLSGGEVYVAQSVDELLGRRKARLYRRGAGLLHRALQVQPGPGPRGRR